MSFISILSPVFLIKKKPFDFYFCSYRKLGKDWKIEDSVLDEIEAFTCAIYGYPRETPVNCVRNKMLKKMVGENKPLSTDSCYKKFTSRFLNNQSHMMKIKGEYVGKQIS